MNDWAAPLIAAALFAFLSPGLVVQMPAKNRAVDFLNMKTSIAAIFVHTVLYASLLAVTLSNGKIISLFNLGCLEVEMKGERGHYKEEMFFAFALGRRDKD
ncbi:hypothetical protein WN944_010332 [Citrus x changshan-huyou]|uniref:Uncharacterized protein n=1 Tax=Citrus x changshan-huyou TaxID=2935761 RepID=A0AAP0MTX2_9ROSI